MSKEYLEAFNRIALHTECDNDSSYDCLCFEDDCKLVDSALQRLESIDNANPSEALELLKETKRRYFNLEYGHTQQYIDHWKNLIKTLDVVEQALIKAQEPKKYLKWEDLKFEEDKLKRIKVKMGNHIYTLEYQSYKNEKDSIIEVADLWLEQRCISRNLGKYVFDDLCLEEVGKVS